MAYDYQQALMDAMQGGGSSYQGDAGTPDDPYQARVDELIRTLSQPDEPQLLPTAGQPSKTQGVLAFLGDALSNLGAVKSRRPLPGNVYLPQIQARQQYETSAAAENARRKRQAGTESRKEGAITELRDIQSKREDTRRRQDAAEAQRQKAYTDAVDYAKNWKVPITDKDGNPKTIKELLADAAVKADKAEQEHQSEIARQTKNQEEDNRRADRQLALSERAATRLEKEAKTKEDEDKPDKVAARQHVEHVRTVREQTAAVSGAIQSINEDGTLNINGQPQKLSDLRDRLVSYAKANNFTDEEMADLQKLFKETIGTKWNKGMAAHSEGKAFVPKPTE